MLRTIEIRSVHDGTVLALSNFVAEDDSAISESFLVSVQNHQLKAEARASSYFAPDLAKYFDLMAKEWQGWEGERNWASLEGEFELKASMDKMGHVTLKYFLRPPHTGFHWELKGAIEIEAGQLESIAKEVRRAWAPAK